MVLRQEETMVPNSNIYAVRHGQTSVSCLTRNWIERLKEAACKRDTSCGKGKVIFTHRTHTLHSRFFLLAWTKFKRHMFWASVYKDLVRNIPSKSRVAFSCLESPTRWFVERNCLRARTHIPEGDYLLALCTPLGDAGFRCNRSPMVTFSFENLPLSFNLMKNRQLLPRVSLPCADLPWSVPRGLLRSSQGRNSRPWISTASSSMRPR